MNNLEKFRKDHFVKCVCVDKENWIRDDVFDTEENKKIAIQMWNKNIYENKIGYEGEGAM